MNCQLAPFITLDICTWNQLINFPVQPKATLRCAVPPEKCEFRGDWQAERIEYLIDIDKANDMFDDISSNRHTIPDKRVTHLLIKPPDPTHPISANAFQSAAVHRASGIRYEQINVSTKLHQPKQVAQWMKASSAPQAKIGKSRTTDKEKKKETANEWVRAREIND